MNNENDQYQDGEPSDLSNDELETLTDPGTDAPAMGVSDAVDDEPTAAPPPPPAAPIPEGALIIRLDGTGILPGSYAKSELDGSLPDFLELAGSYPAIALRGIAFGEGSVSWTDNQGNAQTTDVVVR